MDGDSRTGQRDGEQISRTGTVLIWRWEQTKEGIGKAERQQTKEESIKVNTAHSGQQGHDSRWTGKDRSVLNGQQSRVEGATSTQSGNSRNSADNKRRRKRWIPHRRMDE